MTTLDLIPYRDREIYIEMTSGAVYRGILRRAKVGEPRVFLVDVKICDKNDLDNWLVCPKGGESRYFRVDLISKILRIGETFSSHIPWRNQ